jgi:hypothetical protein
MSVTRAEVEQRFRDFDAAYFEGRLAGRTCVELLVPTQGNHLAQPEDGACKYDGSVIYLNPRSEHDWEGTLLHEMVHAFECCFGEQLAESEEGRDTAARYPPHPFYGGHSPRFFTKLFEVMRARGDEPAADLLRYFR